MGFWGVLFTCFYSPIVKDPQKKHKTKFCHPPSPGTIAQICLCVYVRCCFAPPSGRNLQGHLQSISVNFSRYSLILLDALVSFTRFQSLLISFGQLQSSLVSFNLTRSHKTRTQNCFTDRKVGQNNNQRSCAGRTDRKNKRKNQQKMPYFKICSCSARSDLTNKSARFSGS